MSEEAAPDQELTPFLRGVLEFSRVICDAGSRTNMTAPFRYRETEAEKLHKALYALHSAIYRAAMKPLTEALKVCNELELIEAAGTRAAEFRSRTIRENGCDASCEAARR